MPVNVEVWIILPPGEVQAPFRCNGDLPVPRDEIQLGVYAGHELLKGYGAVENANAGDVKGNFWSFKVKKSSIGRRHSTNWD
jgi:hypothetical protein